MFTLEDIHINSNLDPLKKFSSNRRSTKFEGIFPKYLSSDRKNRLNPQKNMKTRVWYLSFEKSGERTNLF